MKVLVACEFSGIVRDAFKARGHDAWSCDLLPTERPGQHIQGDATIAMNNGFDLVIAHPPCTHLACSGAAWFERKRKDGTQQRGVDLFMAFTKCTAERWCIENPVGIMSSIWRKPDQIIQPFYFGDQAQKTTCLWMRNLPKLNHYKHETLFGDKPTHVSRGEMVRYDSGKVMSKWYAESRGDGHLRSRTFQGIADAMAQQWG